MALGSNSDEETTHRRYERIVGTVTLIATLLAAGFAGGAYVQAKRQADIAQAALIESDHTFLEVSAKGNADPAKIDGTRASMTITIANQGSRAASIQFALFSIMEREGTGARAKLTNPSTVCGGPVLQKVIPPSGSVHTDCTFVLSKPNMPSAHLVGTLVYSGQLGARWRRDIDMVELPTGHWMDAFPNADRESRANVDGQPIPTEKYH